MAFCRIFPARTPGKERDHRYSEHQRKCGPDYCWFYDNNYPRKHRFERCLRRVIEHIDPRLDFFPDAKAAYCPKDYLDEKFEDAKKILKELVATLDSSESGALKGQFTRNSISAAVSLLTELSGRMHTPRGSGPDFNLDINDFVFVLAQTDFTYNVMSCSGTPRDHFNNAYRVPRRYRLNPDGKPYHGWVIARAYGEDPRLDSFICTMNSIEGVEARRSDDLLSDGSVMLDIRASVPNSEMKNKLWLAHLWVEVAETAHKFIPPISQEIISQIRMKHGPAGELFPALFI
ncbi:hypothetical protein KJ780_02135 [Candidatus Micrarchaeota archaeon]|nr:hypothetical protein [Candidatus Micrarchaeota archaeon]